MKFLFKIFLILLIGVNTISCEEAEPIASTFTFLPDIEVREGTLLIWQRGTDYIDPGAVASENGNEIEIFMTGEVNANEVGIYTLNYTATNKDGFSITVERYVLVADNPEAILNIDISGTYVNTMDSSFTSTVTSLGNGFFQFSDVLAGTEIPAIAGVISSSEIVIPRQNSPFGDLIADTSIDPETSATYDERSLLINLRIGLFGVFSEDLIKIEQ